MPLYNRRDLIQKYIEKYKVFGLAKRYLKIEHLRGLGELYEKEVLSKTFDIFLSHRYLDASEILILKEEPNSFGFSVYIDWIEDEQLPRENINKETAQTLRRRLRKCETLLYAYSDNSIDSKWMPWELGFFDGFKGQVALLPIVDNPTNSNTYIGQEYLGIYPYVTKENNDKGDSKLWVNEEDSETRILYDDWLKGEKLN